MVSPARPLPAPPARRRRHPSPFTLQPSDLGRFSSVSQVFAYALRLAVLECTSAMPSPRGQSTNVCLHWRVFPDPEVEAKAESTTGIDKYPIAVLNKVMFI
ncbi:hypothetical protein E2C01_080044 [Portunus trituberculatus]|uniref:Uncharacterized protein n=1 Tax=Portunus trituberculatus TaxID=210409 RepID=A0A5B7IXD0_PORTR|nr:hypothetical protein [Portunus trituberculatus]